MGDNTSPLRQARIALGMTQTRAAIEMGVHPSFLSRVERGELKPWPKFRRDAARVLGRTEAELFGG